MSDYFHHMESEEHELANLRLRISKLEQNIQELTERVVAQDKELDRYEVLYLAVVSAVASYEYYGIEDIVELYSQGGRRVESFEFPDHRKVREAMDLLAKVLEEMQS